MDHELQRLLQAIHAAGQAILNVQQTGVVVARKSNNDIVTKADLLANDILKQQLLSAFPADGWLSEESSDDHARFSATRVWIVDPIDGTKEFARGIPEYAISVALVVNRSPVLAAVFNPASKQLFHAVKGHGAWLNHKKIHCRNAAEKDMWLLASRTEAERGDWEKFQRNYQVKVVGSIAYKLALVAAGKAQATWSLGPKNEWDIAAGALLVAEAGGIVTDIYRNQIQFNRENVLVAGIVATAPDVNAKVFELIS